MKTNAFLRYPTLTGVSLALLSFFAGAVAVEAADFGAPAWVFVLSLAWLATIGLPTTLAVLLLAALWGRTEPLYGFWPFCVVAAMLATFLQVLTLKAFALLKGGSHEN